MAITNKRLKAYINSNTTSVIRSRAKACRVTSLYISPNNNQLEAKINGSSGIPYEVTFTGLTSNPIKSSCTCPFEHGNVCKHVVAVAEEAEAYFSEKVIEEEIPIENPENKSITKTIKQPQKKHSITGPYLIPAAHFNNFEIDEVIRQNASATLYREYELYDFDSLKINVQKDEYIHFLIPESYWGNNYFDVMLRKNPEEVVLLCNCRATNKNLCRHQAIVLNYISEHIPYFFQSEEKTNEIKEALLQEYGFTLKDPNYKDYFSFEYRNGELEVRTKKEGIVRLSKFKDYENFKSSFLAPSNVIKDQIPVVAKNKRLKKEKGVGLLFVLDFRGPHGENLSIVPIQGNYNKEKTDFASKIEEIEPEDLLLDGAVHIQNEVELLKKVFQLAQLNYSNTLADETLLKTQFQYVKEIIALIKETHLVYLTYDYPGDKIYRRDLTFFEINKTHPSLFFKVEEEAHFYVLKAYAKLNKKSFQIIHNKQVNNLFFLNVKDDYYPYKSFYEAKAFMYFNEEPQLRIHKNDFEEYYNSFIKELSNRFEVQIKHKKRTTKKLKKEALKKQVYLTEYEDTIVFRPVIEYNDTHIDVFSTQIIEEEKNEKTYVFKRDAQFEEAFVEEVRSLHPHFVLQEQDFFYLEKEAFIVNAWFLDAFEQLKKYGIEVFGFDKLSKIKYNRHKPSINVQTNSGIDWFDVSIAITFGDQAVSLKEVRKSILKKSNYVQLKDGTLGILPKEWLEKYSHAFRAGEVKKEGIIVSKYQLSVIDSLYDTLDADSEMVTNHLKIKDRLNTFNKIDQVVAPKGLKATLRDYQREGLNWLNFLDEYNFGGCLADDMGLGKTLQIITFLKHLKNTQKPKNASLIVLPTSLIFNWQEEVKKFSPSLKFIVHTGSNREKTVDKFETVDIVFTTYGIVMRDIDLLKTYAFNYIILDESQAIKNPSSQRFKSVRLLQANNRLVLTGTPIENNTFDLYAQMTFVNPGLLGNMANFKNEYATPIDKHKDTQVANDLRKLVNPFLLRRTKEQVAKELPEKTEQVLYCTMEKAQQKLYDAYKNKYRDYLLGKIEDDGLGKSKMYVLEGLTKLRQICDAPQLLNDEEEYTSESIKVQKLIEHITEKTGNHKILIFSQFVKMLSIIKKELTQHKIKFEYLDGKTKNRQAKVDHFQNNDEVRVFLISLKAGGTGLNLTAADYVYLVDPWWNPAVEAQAIDRCYRIGQTKKVMAYKMICKGTVEEKIINYQLQKKQLSNDIIQTDESFVKNLTKENITDLFS